jgi:hypothetical protein
VDTGYAVGGSPKGGIHTTLRPSELVISVVVFHAFSANLNKLAEKFFGELQRNPAPWTVGPTDLLKPEGAIFMKIKFSN